MQGLTPPGLLGWQMILNAGGDLGNYGRLNYCVDEFPSCDVSNCSFEERLLAVNKGLVTAESMSQNTGATRLADL